MLNKELGTNFPEVELSEEDKLKMFRKTISYMPLIDDYNELYESSMRLPSEDENDYKRFYLNLFIFMADFAFIESKFAYTGAFKTTGILAKELKLYKV